VSSPVVEAFAIDEENEAKFWAHGLTVEQVVQVLESAHTIKRNRKERRASHLIVGTDRQGRCIAVPIEPTHQRGVLRPVTAWPCKPHEWSWLP
jgi:uncharacterized DUF497 family protein